MPKRGGRRKKTRTHVVETEQQQQAANAEKIPKSLVIRKGRTAVEVGELIQDCRQMMLPYTALHFQEVPRSLTLQQYANHLALPMGISHMFLFSQTNDRLNMRLARTPQGPTLHFQVHQFSLNHHIKALQRRPVASGTASLTNNPPIVVTNNFTADTPHVKLLRITFQNIFPSINVGTVKLNDCRRVVLFNLVEREDGTQIVEWRHYAIKATPKGVNRRVRRILQANKLPNLNKVNDIADYLENAAQQSDAASDSEPEDDPSHVVQLADNYTGKGNVRDQKSALKLVELGPRLSIELFKVEKGLGAGDVLYHSRVQKTPEEAASLKQRKEKERMLKHQRRAEQEANVERKRVAAEEKREVKRQRQQQKEQTKLAAQRAGPGGGESSSEDDDDDSI